MKGIERITDESMLERAIGGTEDVTIPIAYCKACGKAAVYVSHSREGGANITYFKCTNPECSDNGVQKEASEFDKTPRKS